MRWVSLLALISVSVPANAQLLPDILGHADCGHAMRLKKAARMGFAPNEVRMSSIEAVEDTDVLHNTLNIELAPPSNVISADNTIHVRSLSNNLTEFTFRLSDSFSIGTVTLDGRPISITRIDPTTCRAEFDRPYALDEEFTLHIPYGGPAISAFFGSIQFGTRASGAPYAFTLSEPWYAYTWWPNKDDNTDKSTFDTNITVPDTMKAVGAGLLQGTDVVPGNRLRYRWRTNYQMVPYLAFLGATNFNTWSSVFNHAGGQMPVQYWIWPESDTAANRAAWEKCVPMLSAFTEAYGPYPFINEKYGMYQFTFGGGMEHQTCSGMGGFWESVDAHEVAHQWWGNMVTCATWHDIWLNEGFARYSEALWNEKKAGGSFAAYKATMNTNRPSQTSGTVYCYDISDPNRIFSGTYTYNKGGWAVHMLRGIVGEAMLNQIFAEYRAEFADSAATTDDFIAVCERVYGGDLNWFFDKFVYGGGAPAYRWAWQSVVSNGKNYLLVYIRQAQNTSFGTFTMPVDIRPTVAGVKQPRKVFNDALTQNFVIPVSAPVTACTFDEDAWILSSSVSTTAFSSGGPTIVETVPAPNSLVKSRIPELRVTFHTAVVATAADFEVRSSTSRLPVPFTYVYDSATNTAKLGVGKSLPSAEYTVTVRDSIRAVNSNKQLDGEIGSSSVLPSGNGQPAGNAVIKFRVRG